MIKKIYIVIFLNSSAIFLFCVFFIVFVLFIFSKTIHPRGELNRADFHTCHSILKMYLSVPFSSSVSKYVKMMLTRSRKILKQKIITHLKTLYTITKDESSKLSLLILF